MNAAAHGRKTKGNMKTWGRSLITAVLIAVTPLDLALPAQAAAKPPPPPASPAPPADVGTQGLANGPPPYDEELLRLSEILGSNRRQIDAIHHVGHIRRDLDDARHRSTL